MTEALTVACSEILASHLMDSTADADKAPALVKTQVADDIRHPEPGGIRHDLAIHVKGSCGSVHRAINAFIMSQLGSNRGGEAVTELGGVGQNLDAIIISVTRGLGVEVAHQLGRAEDVEERLRLAEGE